MAGGSRAAPASTIDAKMSCKVMVDADLRTSRSRDAAKVVHHTTTDELNVGRGWAGDVARITRAIANVATAPTNRATIVDVKAAQPRRNPADAVNNAFAAMKNDHPNKAEMAALADKIAKVERIVYGACGTILLGVLGALIALVVVKP